jgi:flavin reductase (DIM6/NTAB) family NADH-FMN oxidoreductase RutF
MKFNPKEMADREGYLFMGNVVIPRPIALVSTVSKSGLVNVAPYSLFNVVCYWPPIVFISPHRKPDDMKKGTIRRGDVKKDTLRNVEDTKEFVVNMVVEDISEAMSIAAAYYPPHVSELDPANLTTVPSDLVEPPRIAESPINLECRLTEVIQFGKPKVIADMILGEVLRVHIEDRFYRDGKVDSKSLRLIGKMGYNIYTRTTDQFEMKVPVLEKNQKE